MSSQDYPLHNCGVCGALSHELQEGAWLCTYHASRFRTWRNRYMSGAKIRGPVKFRPGAVVRMLKNMERHEA